MSDPKPIGTANARRRPRRRRLLAAFAFVAALGIAIYLWSGFHGTPGTVYALDARTGKVAWAIRPHQDYLELSWRKHRLLLWAVGGTCDSRDGNYFVINQRTGRTNPSNYQDKDEFRPGRALPTAGSVSFGGRSYEKEPADEWAPGHLKVQAVKIVNPTRFSGTRRVFWSVRRPLGIQPVAVDTRIVLVAPPEAMDPQPGGPKSLEALDRRTGRLLWSRSLAAFGTRGDTYVNYPQPQLSNGVVFAYIEPFRMAALDAATGRLLWTARVAPAREMAVGPNLVVALGDGTVTALTRQGHVLWSDRLEGDDPEPDGTALALDKHMVYVAEEGRAPFSTCSPS